MIGFGVMTKRLNPYDLIFRVFGGFFDPSAPQIKIQNSVLIESECSRFGKFRENLVEIGLVDSERFD